MLISTHRHINELKKKTKQVGSGCCHWLFFTLYYLGDPPPNSQVNHTRRLILPYKCPSLAFLNLNYPFYLFPLGFCLFLFCILFFTSLCLAGWLAPKVFFLLLLHPLFSLLLLFILCACQLPPPIPALLLTVQLFISPIRCFRQAK